MASVELRRVTKVYPHAGATRVLDELNLLVNDGELLVLLGPNGSGKTTLLRLIAGLERVTSGEVLIGGEIVNDRPPRRRDVAMVFQSGVLYPHLTVEKNLTFGIGNEGGGIGWIWSRLTNRAGIQSGERSDEQGRANKKAQADNKDRTALQDRVRETAQLLGIESLLNRLPRQLSGGERQRVALGRALVRQPAVFLLDEPLANADTKLRQEMRMVFQRARQRFPGTMILVSHDHSEALALGQRIAVLGNGKVQQVGLARDVYASPTNRYVAEFLGRWSMTFLEGEWRQENGRFFLATPCGLLRVPEHVSFKLVGPGSRTRNSRVSLGLRMGAVAVGGKDEADRKDEADLKDEADCRSEVGWRGQESWRGTVRWVEFRGMDFPGETVVMGVALPRSDRGEVTIAVSAGDSERVQVGDSVQLEVDWNRALWFDPETGSNLLAGKS